MKDPMDLVQWIWTDKDISFYEMEQLLTLLFYCYFQTPGSCREIDREKYKDFTFDHSYWSCDASDDNYASQEEVYITWFFQSVSIYQFEINNTYDTD